MLRKGPGATIAITAGAGLPAFSPVARLTVAILLSFLVRTLPGQGTTQGYARIDGETGSLPVATALFSLRREGILVSEAAIEGNPPIRSGRILVDPSFSTGLAVANPWDQSVTLTLTLRDAGGQMVAEPLPFELGPRAQRADFVSVLFPEASALSTLASLTFEVTTEGSPGVGAVTIRQAENLDGAPLFATLPVAELSPGPAASTGTSGMQGSFVLPHLGAGSGLSTQLVLISRSDTATPVRIQLFGTDGQPLLLHLDGAEATTFDIDLAPRGVFLGTLTTPGGTRQGYAVVSYTGQAPAGTAVFQFRTAESALISEAGVGARSSTKHFRILVDAIGTQTGVAIASPGNPALELTVKLLSREGILLETRQIGFPSNGQTAAFAETLFNSLPPGFLGQIEVVSPLPVVPISLKLTANSLGNPVLTTLPVADLDAPARTGPILLAQIGFGISGPFELATRIVFLPTSIDQSGSGSLRFFSTSGSPLSVALAGSQKAELDYLLPGGAVRQFRPGNQADARSILLPSHELGREIVVNSGSRLQLEPLIIDSAGDLRDDFSLQYTANDPLVVSVSSSGLIEGEEAGFATLAIATGSTVAAFTVVVPEISGGAGGFGITGIEGNSSGQLFLAASDRHAVFRSEELSSLPEIYAGVDQQSGFRDDLRPAALFNSPAYLALDQAAGTLFVSDTLNHSLRRIGPGQSGEVMRLAGGPGPGSRDGELEQASFDLPRGVVLDGRGNLWVSDSGNHTIRRIDLARGVVETMAGLAGLAGSSDGTGANARFNQPAGLALEVEPLAIRLEREQKDLPAPPLSLLVADAGNGRVRRVFEDGTVETLGTGNPDSADPAGSEIPAQFRFPVDVAVDNLGNIFVADRGAGKVEVFLREGELVAATEEGTFDLPGGLAVTGLGTLAVSEASRTASRLQFGSPEISAITPDRIASGSITTVTVQGRNFAPETLIFVAGRQITELEYVDSRTLRLAAPDLPSGRATLTLQNRGGLVQESIVIEAFPVADLAPGAITTFVGGTSFRGDGGEATEASFNLPSGIDYSSEGALYLADRNNHRIRRIDPRSGIVNTVAGSGLFEGENLGDGASALVASLFFPEDVAVGIKGELIIADTFHDRIRKVDPGTGIISTIAGLGEPGPAGDGGPPLQAFLNTPTGVAVDRSGNIFVADAENHRIRVIDAAGQTILTVAGDGTPGFSGDGGAALQARLFRPNKVAVSPDGNLLIADPENSRIREVDLETGLIRTVAGDGVPDFSGDGGPAILASLRNPLDMVFDLDDNLVVADSLNNRIRRISALDERISSIAGSGDRGFAGDGGSAAEALLDTPYAVALDGAGNLAIADTFNQRIRQVNSRDGRISTLGGSDLAPRLGDNGPATEASLALPHSVAVAPEDFLFVLDTLHERLRWVDLRNGMMLTSPSTILEGIPTGLAASRFGEVFISNLRQHHVLIIFPDTALLVAGRSGFRGFSGDNGPASQALLNRPEGLATDFGGNIYIADRFNHRIRRVNRSTLIITTVAGNGTPGFSGDGGAATAARLNEPVAAALDAEGNLYISDRANHCIRRVSTMGVITTVAGTGMAGYSGDGGPAPSARLFRPRAIALDAGGNIFIADEFNHRVRRVDSASGIITTVAGTGVAEFSGDGGAAVSAGLFSPGGLAVDDFGNLLIADMVNNRVRAIPGLAAPAVQGLRPLSGRGLQGAGAPRHWSFPDAFQGPLREDGSRFPPWPPIRP